MVATRDLSHCAGSPLALVDLAFGRQTADMIDTSAITVGIDGSEPSANALGWAAREAERRQVVLRVVHSYTLPVYGAEFGGSMVFMPSDMETFETAHNKLVEDQLAPIRATYPTLAVETHIVIGGAVASIIDQAKDAQMVVTGSSGAGSVKAVLLGSVAHGVAHHSPCPVVLVPTERTHPVRMIVVGTDGSRASDAAVDWARREALLWDAEITVVHVWDYPYLDLDTRDGAVLPSDLMKSDAEEVLRHGIDTLEAHPERPRKVHARLLEGAPSSALVDIAKDCDLLVIGARGRGAIKAALLGSTSSYAIHHAQCPIAIVHAPPTGPT